MTWQNVQNILVKEKSRYETVHIDNIFIKYRSTEKMDMLTVIILKWLDNTWSVFFSICFSVFCYLGISNMSCFCNNHKIVCARILYVYRRGNWEPVFNSEEWSDAS